jgi:hypothetical protein
MPACDLTELVYASAATTPFSTAELRTLLTKARVNNAALGVTGILIHVNGSFLQVLEGPADTVETLFGRIGRDSRHHRVLRLFAAPKTERSFGDWTMGFAESSPATQSIAGFNDFFRAGLARAHFDAGDADRARGVLDEFRKGRWRQHLSGG